MGFFGARSLASERQVFFAIGENNFRSELQVEIIASSVGKTESEIFAIGKSLTPFPPGTIVSCLYKVLGNWRLIAAMPRNRISMETKYSFQHGGLELNSSGGHLSVSLHSNYLISVSASFVPSKWKPRKRLPAFTLKAIIFTVIKLGEVFKLFQENCSVFEAVYKENTGITVHFSCGQVLCVAHAVWGGSQDKRFHLVFCFFFKFYQVHWGGFVLPTAVRFVHDMLWACAAECWCII